MLKLILVTAFLLHAGAHSGEDQTLMIDSVRANGPAESAGIKAGDRIVGLDGQKIETLDDLQKIMAAKQPGEAMPVTVQRNGKDVDLSVTLGELPGGGASIGVSIAVYEGEVPADVGEGTDDCLAWVEDTYKIQSLSEGLGLDVSDDYETTRSCIEHDTRAMGRANAVKYCDNVFKVHCGGLDLLAEIGEAQVRSCEERLTKSLGINVAEQKSWKTCGQHKVIDRYSISGESSDTEGACKAAFVECSGDGA